ncbi:hypothetical protein IB258_15045 [Achromobacter sp. ACM02]|uniref:hypothetical protein n=1 Tax=Achromobacter TaxID=222 RepID=UPI001581EB56|nr:MULTISPECIES: hypothetical protein [Achromobacter]MBD9382567.1 hypothetical protein [Achromobacter sp. ACM02]
MYEFPVNILLSGKSLAVSVFQLLPVVWGAGILLCVESALPGLSPKVWRRVRDVVAVMMAVFLLVCGVYAIFGYSVSVIFGQPGYFHMTGDGLWALCLSIGMAVLGLVLRARARPVV